MSSESRFVDSRHSRHSTRFPTETTGSGSAGGWEDGSSDQPWDDLDGDYYGESSYAVAPNIGPGPVLNNSWETLAFVGQHLETASPCAWSSYYGGQWSSGLTVATMEMPAPSLPHYHDTSASLLICPGCGRDLQNMSSRDRDRHLDTHNRDSPNTPMYRCCCEFHFLGSRKDNYLRHVQKCTRLPDSDKRFKCKCGMSHIDKAEHIQHVTTECGVGRPGRRTGRLPA